MRGTERTLTYTHHKRWCIGKRENTEIEGVLERAKTGEAGKKSAVE